MLRLDHLVVAAETLEVGCDHVEAALGVRPGPGGLHARFGTHNRLLGLGEGLYLEVIAIDPEAPEPSRPRWFGLDDFSGPPRLLTWVCATRDLEAAPEEAGPPVEMERGDLRWRMCVPPGGALPFDQCYPAILQWDGSDHPADRLDRSGLVLRRFTVQHPEAELLNTRLGPLLVDDRVAIESGPRPRLCAEFTGPGKVALLL
ncbi:Glyoxalase-like domain-containing protein [Poseidonocella pacifica]|uniref:Glyoxalase-like domain-containing protein n=1 Tax=Poseidonocella pacifica TaxID=871651 RepID=A0A1I0XBW7_9RHOB|nr:VOC family protein [Poseidonocella pacifica]SFA97916.1 Glyoxalase-like domain-containing protein [Poseidonocella pacifica]